MGDFFFKFCCLQYLNFKVILPHRAFICHFSSKQPNQGTYPFYTNYSRALLMKIQDGYKFQSHDHSLILIWSVILPHCALVFSETHLPSFNADNLIGALIPLLQTTSTVPMLSSRYIQMRYWPLKLSDRRQMPLLILTT